MAGGATGSCGGIFGGTPLRRTGRGSLITSRGPGTGIGGRFGGTPTAVVATAAVGGCGGSRAGKGFGVVIAAA